MMATIVRNNEETDGSANNERKSLSSQEFQSTKHALPPTRISHTILHENASQERHLKLHMAAISTRQNLMSSKLESSKRHFVDSQARKERKWKREDEMRATSMNFPQLPASKVDVGARPSSMTILYKSPQYKQCENDNETAKVLRGGGSLLPYMQLRRERTEILQHKGNVFYMTKLPSLIQVDSEQYEDYIKYCGSGVDKLGAPLLDQRFNELQKLLSPNGGYFEKTEDKNETATTIERKPSGLQTKIPLSLPPLMTGGVTTSCPPDQIKREFRMHNAQKKFKRRTNWKRLRTVVSTCAKFKNQDSSAEVLLPGKERRKKKDVAKQVQSKYTAKIEIKAEESRDQQPKYNRKSLDQLDRVVHSKQVNKKRNVTKNKHSVTAKEAHLPE